MQLWQQMMLRFLLPASVEMQLRHAVQLLLTLERRLQQDNRPFYELFEQAHDVALRVTYHFPAVRDFVENIRIAHDTPTDLSLVQVGMLRCTLNRLMVDTASNRRNWLRSEQAILRTLVPNDDGTIGRLRACNRNMRDIMNPFRNVRLLRYAYERTRATNAGSSSQNLTR
jgi:hypothetical protein